MVPKSIPTESGGSCPVSPSRVGHSLSSGFGFGNAYGSEAVYALMEVPGGFKAPNGDKILWITAPRVRGSLTLTGKALDGDGVIEFGQPGSWKSSMRLTPDGKDWEGWPSSEHYAGGGTCWRFHAVLPSQTLDITVLG